ncbi:MAG: YihY/virulence factor BrkB family protein, partial [Cetobacterium sp.]
NSSPLNEETIKDVLEIAQNLLENTRSGIIAGVGFLSLGWVVISTFSVIEKALNSIWGIKKTRSFFRKISDYLLVFFMLPISIISANLFNNFEIKFLYTEHIIYLLAPYFTLWIFFIFFYTVLPNTKVSLIPTIWSSFIVSFLLNQSNMLLVKLQIVIGTYNKIYGSFSVLLLSLIWLKIVWFLILIGAHFSYILQNREILGKIEDIKKINFKSKYLITKKALLVLVKNYLDNQKPITSLDLSNELKIPVELSKNILEELKKINYISVIENDLSDEKQYKLTMCVEIITFKKLYKDLEEIGETLDVEVISFDENTKICDYFKNI